MEAAKILPFHFLMMTLLGVWCPDHWSTFRKYLQHLYMLIVVTLMFSLVGLQLARLVLVELSLDEFNDTLYIAMATSGACFKVAYYLAHREQIFRLIDMFQVARCLARDDVERNIKRTYDANCTLFVKTMLLLVWTSSSAMIGTGLHAGPQSRRLPYEILRVYSLSSHLAYWLTFALLSWMGYIFSGTNVISDAIVAGFMNQLCAQFDLMAHRLHLLPRQARAITSIDVEDIETFLLRDNVQYHIYCYEIAKSIICTFKGLIVVQFYASTLQISLSVYQLAFRTTNIVEFVNSVIYLACMLVTLAIYCYYGNELTHKSVQFRDSIFEVNWTSLTVNTKKNLAFMILCASKPIEISDGAFVRLTMETFGSVIKVSYSAFNFMRSSK